MSSSISDIGNLTSQQFLLKSLRLSMNARQQQIATGKKATKYSGLTPTESTNSMTFRQNVSQLDTYIQNINVGMTRMKVMDEAMIDITDIARDVAAQMRSQVQDRPPEITIMQDSARLGIQQVTNRLNSKLGDRFLFGGSAINTPPYDVTAGNLTANFTALTTGWLGSGISKAQVLTDSRVLVDNQLDIDPAVLTANNVTIPVDEGVNIDYTVRASNTGFQDILRGLSVIANMPNPTTQAEQDDYWVAINGAIELLDAGAKKIDEEIAILGNKARIMEDNLADHQETQGTMEIFIGEEEDINMAEAVTQMQQLQIQLEASYNVTATLKDTSLVFFI